MSHVDAFLLFFTNEVEYSSAQCYTYPNTNQCECTELEDYTSEACSTPFHPPSAHFLPGMTPALFFWRLSLADLVHFSGLSNTSVTPIEQEQLNKSY